MLLHMRNRIEILNKRVFRRLRFGSLGGKFRGTPRSKTKVKNGLFIICTSISITLVSKITFYLPYISLRFRKLISLHSVSLPYTTRIYIYGWIFSLWCRVKYSIEYLNDAILPFYKNTLPEGISKRRNV